MPTTIETRRALIGKHGRPQVEMRKATRADDAPDAKEAPVITGYASVFYDGTPETQFQLWPGCVERIMPGAFDEAIAKGDVRALFNHDPDNVLGRTGAASPTLRLKADRVGLHYEISPPDTQVGRDVVTIIERGDIDGSSFAFNIPPDGQVWRVEDVGGVKIEVREIHTVGTALYDVGPVTYPAYAASTTGIRSIDSDLKEARESHRRWTEAQAAPAPPAVSREAIMARARVVELMEAEAIQ